MKESVIVLDKYKLLSNLIEFIPKDKIKIEEPMSKHTSFKTGGNAEIFVIIENENQIKKLLEYTRKNDIKLYIIGNGSNLIVQDEGVKGIVAKIAFEETIVTKDEENVIVKAGAGVKVMALAQMLKQEEITGFEELSGFPGTIGGANYMNAGAYGKEMKDVIVETKALNRETGKIEVLNKEEQKLEYINADDIAKELNPTNISKVKISAGKETKRSWPNKMPKPS